MEVAFEITYAGYMAAFFEVCKLGKVPPWGGVEGGG